MVPEQVSLHVLGRLRVLSAGAEVPLPARKLRQLLAALVLANGPRSRQRLVEDLWGEDPPRSADKVLQQYVSQLRRAVPLLPLATTGDGYLLAVEPDVVDARRFELLVASGRRAARMGELAQASSLLHRALALFDGPAYAEFAHEEMAAAESARLDGLRQDALEDRWEADLGLGRHTAVRAELSAQAAAEPLRERLQGLAVLAAYRAGHQGEALELYRRAREALVSELGVEPSSALRDLHQRVLEQDELLAAPTEPDAWMASLPVPLKPLRGRERELKELHELLIGDDARLVVLTGPGGAGKSRLALQIARDVAGGFAHGAAFVELASVRDPLQLMAACCTRLGVERQGPNAVDDLVLALRGRELLLVLDNLEQLRSAGPELVELLTRSPGLRLLVTSRVVLHLSGEHVFPVPPLADDDAVALLLERAHEAGAGLDLGGQTGTVRRLCARLDGLPLAIELAAARLRTLTTEELYAQLESHLPVLAGGAHDLPSRQQTLEATLSWSHDLLPAQEQRALARLSVFPDGCTLGAAQDVCDVSMDSLSVLLDHNLLTRTTRAGGSRYTMLETVRVFAAGRLQDAPALRRRHAQHTLEVALALGLSVDARGTVGVQGLAGARLMAQDVHASLDWAQETDPELGLRLAVAVEQYWITTDPREGVRRFTTLLSKAADVPLELQALAYRDLGGSVEVAGDWERAEQHYLHSLSLYERLDDPLGALALKHRLANAHLYRGDPLAARHAAEEALSTARALDHGFLEADLLGTLAEVDRLEGQPEAGYRREVQALELYRSLGGWPWGEVISLANLAEMAAEIEHLEEATAHALACVDAARMLGDPISVVLSLSIAAIVARAVGDDERAGVLWGAVEAEEQRTFLGRWSSMRVDLAPKVLVGASAELEQGQRLGRGLSLSAAIEYALGAPVTFGVSSGSGPVRRRG